jgi:hypothetical protein
MTDGDDPHRHEARIFSRYLIGAEPTEDMIARYIRAQSILFGAAEPDSERALCRFARRHPWSLPYLDASSVWTRQSLLRKKLLTMSAILEASPEFADVFLPRKSVSLYLHLRLAAIGLKSVAKQSIGLPILLWARWSAR